MGALPRTRTRAQRPWGHKSRHRTTCDHTQGHSTRDTLTDKYTQGGPLAHTLPPVIPSRALTNPHAPYSPDTRSGPPALACSPVCWTLQKLRRGGGGQCWREGWKDVEMRFYTRPPACLRASKVSTQLGSAVAGPVHNASGPSGPESRPGQDSSPLSSPKQTSI